MKSWATTDDSKSGKAHLWREAESESRMAISECGLVTMASQLQAEGEAIGRCKKCERYIGDGESQR